MESLKVIKSITEKVNTRRDNVPLETDIGNQLCGPLAGGEGRVHRSHSG